MTRSVLEINDHLSAAGHDLLVVAPQGAPTRVGTTPVSGMPAFPLPRYPTLVVGVPTRRLSAELRAFRPDVVYVANPVVLGAGALRAAKQLGLPTVAIHQTDLAGFAQGNGLGPLRGPIWRWLSRVYNWADIVLAPSTAALWDLRRHGVERVALWPRGVDLNAFDPAHRSPRLRRAFAPDGQVIVGYSGRLSPEKRVHLLAGLLERQDIRLVVVGTGPCRAELEQRLAGAVFTGPLHGNELSRAYASLDVFVHTGAHETFCQAIQEALASGVPVVAPAAGGPLDLVCHGVNGYLYPPADRDLLVAAVDHLSSRADLRRAMGRAARQAVAGRSWSAVSRMLEEHMRSVITGEWPYIEQRAA